MKIEHELDPVQFLSTHFLERKEKNERYSLRAFSRDLGVSAPQLSRILSRQRTLTYRQMLQIANALNLSEKESNFWVGQVILSAQKNAKVSAELRQRVIRRGLNMKKKPLSISEFPVGRFKVISQWYHLAILELTYVKDFESSPEWIASALGISVIETKAALERLLTLGLLEVTRHGVIKKTQSTLMMKPEKSEPEIRKYETTMIEKAKGEVHKITQAEWQNRVINSITFPSNPSAIPELKNAILEFQKTIFSLIKKHEYQSVYHLGIQLFPVSKNSRSKA